ncbi:MAG: hypothetical protein CEN87_649 [Parcubacteria group bacterium Licking1014_1]|nr:MAG: hypothetical protein CEN87_649 [Parcubacteria group bacterium Licking1014_1]
MFNFFRKKPQEESLEEQRADIECYQPPMRDDIISGEDCDIIPSASGEFGRSLTNPIPVNGIRGEIKYINRLRCPNGSGMIFHRLGSIKINQGGIERCVDIYELVSIDGSFWDILYFDMYHPRRSTIIPEKYTFSNFDKLLSRIAIGFGVNIFAENFPFGIPNLIATRYDSFGKSLAERLRNILVDQKKFIPTTQHRQAIQEINKTINRFQSY